MGGGGSPWHDDLHRADFLSPRRRWTLLVSLKGSTTLELRPRKEKPDELVRITLKAGSFLIFPSMYEHHGLPPTDSCRIVYSSVFHFAKRKADPDFL